MSRSTPTALLVLLASAPVHEAMAQRPSNPDPRVTTERLRAATALIGLDFTSGGKTEKLDLMLRNVSNNLASFERLRGRALDNSVTPALGFTPFLPGVTDRSVAYQPRPIELPAAERPDSLEALAFADIPTLAALIKARKVSCVELTKFFIGRLRKLDSKLHCVITITEERALAAATKLDEELAGGKWRGPLHGIPWGAKDLLAVPGYPTTWGAKPYEKQVIDATATVVERLDAAGAVLIAKLTLGALAWGDVWFGGTTRNPWNPEQGSSGSSAGPASATAAGACPFTIGSETLGSIVSPSVRCGCSSLRPTFGRVSRHGAMALSWSMDKLGPICRSAADAAIVFEAIQGPDGKDGTVFDKPFTPPRGVDIKGIKVGIVRGTYRNRDRAPVLRELGELGVEFVDVDLPRYPVRDMTFILNCEGAAAFDDLTRSGRDDQLVRQIRNAWPNVFRASRLIPAVEYIQANRLRHQLMRAWDKALAGCDVIVHPPFAAGILAATNLTGHPTVVAPYGRSRRNNQPGSICFTGQLADEARLLAVVEAWQAKTAYHRSHPDL